MNISSHQLSGAEKPVGLLVGLDSTHYTALSFLLAVITATFRPGSVLRKGFLSLQLVVVLQAFIALPPTTETNTAVTYTTGLLLGNLTARYFDRLYIHVPEDEFHRVKANGEKEYANKLSWQQKIWWALELFSVNRGLGWDWQVGGIPKVTSQPSRSRFVIVRLAKYVLMYAGLYVAGLTAQNIRNNWVGVQSTTLREILVTATTNVYVLYLFVVVGYGIAIYSHFGVMTLPLSILCVGLRIGPEDWQDVGSWPPNFGSIRHAYSIRRFWGYVSRNHRQLPVLEEGSEVGEHEGSILANALRRYTWHQQLRRSVGAPGAALLSLCPYDLRTSKNQVARLTRRYFLIIASFISSGVLHASGSWATTRAHGLPLSHGGELWYFILQGISLMVEDFACYTLGVNDQAGPPSAQRLWLGYAVTATWFIWSRVYLKLIPLAEHGHGIVDERGGIYAALELVERNTKAVPGNFVATALGGY